MAWKNSCLRRRSDKFENSWTTRDCSRCQIPPFKLFLLLERDTTQCFWCSDVTWHLFKCTVGSDEDIWHSDTFICQCSISVRGGHYVLRYGPQCTPDVIIITTDMNEYKGFNHSRMRTSQIFIGTFSNDDHHPWRRHSTALICGTLEEVKSSGDQK